MKYVLLAAAIILSLAGCGAGGKASSSKDAKDDPVVAEYRESRDNLRQAIENAQQYIPEDRRIDINAPYETPSGDAVYVEEQPAADDSPAADASENDTPVDNTSENNNIQISTSKEDLQQMLKDNEGLAFNPGIPNDPAGILRAGVYNSNTSQENLALDYYKAFFGNDSEIHALINSANKTTACVQVMGDELDVTLTEYVDKEETDADLLFSGTFLSEYNVNINTGEIKKIQ